MSAALRRILVLCLIVSPLTAFAFGDWQPSADELKMTSYAAAPDAPAVYLFREETVDDNIHIHTVYARVKILSEKGKEMFGDIEIPYEGGMSNIRSVSGRTIHSDGTVIPFTGKPMDKLLAKQGHERVMEKVFSMPDVQVGSILEYRWVLNYDDAWVISPHWLIQQDIPVVKAHYHFVSSSARGGNMRSIVSNQFGHQITANQLLYTYVLPTGDKLTQQADGSYDATVENIPAVPQEDYLPPIQSFSYRIIFYYSPFHNPADYWKTNGKYWSSDFDHFANPSGKIRQAVSGIVAPGDTDEQKVEKIYAAVMKVENTSFTREHSAEENKAEGLKVKSAEDVWAQQRGNDDEITRLFVAMVRAAGLKAYGAAVTNRDRNLFSQNYMTWDQLDDELAIVLINGKETFFDPGQRYCEFGKLHWKHTWAGGVRQTDGGTQFFTTPGLNYKENTLDRNAQLTLDSSGHLSGQLFEKMTGTDALRWRQAALRADEAAIKKDFDDELQHSMPPGVTVKTNHFVGLTDYTTPLMAIVDVSGTLGTQTGKHVFMPAVFFEAGNAPLFAQTHRENLVDLQFPYTVHDQFALILPSNIKIESVPKEVHVPFAPNADYVANFGGDANTYQYARLLRVANILYKADEYPSLRDFYQKLSADDQEQVALTLAPVASPAGTTASVAPAASGK